MDPGVGDTTHLIQVDDFVLVVLVVAGVPLALVTLVIVCAGLDVNRGARACKLGHRVLDGLVRFRLAAVPTGIVLTIGSIDKG